MRRSRIAAGGLALVAVAAPGCGMSTKEEVKPRDPSGSGQVRTPDVSVESVDELRSVEVVVNRGRFQPQQASIGLDGLVRIQNEDTKVAKLRKLRGPGGPIRDPILQPGEQTQVDFLRAGVLEVGLEGSKARLQVNVFP
jgi:hypothetical protein